MGKINIKVGDTYEFSKKVSNEDVFSFAEVSGDKNPLHLDDEYAKNTMFGGRIAHGMIGAGVISAAIGMGMPGVGTTYLGQTLKFKKAVRIDDTLTVELEVTSITEKEKFDIATMKTICKNQDGDVVIEGEATVIPPRV
ncbi:MAG: MaoC family dehydratase [Lachnospiraceae bacterium]|nr:MaoC family dehydratase [Lachnospiraceae bacterium]